MMRLKHINSLMPIYFLINISSAVLYHSIAGTTNQFFNNKQLSPSSSNWIPTDNYNHHQQQERKNSYLSYAYTPKVDIPSRNNKIYENYLNDITVYGETSSPKPIITNDNSDYHENQKLLLKSSSSSSIQPYGYHQEQQQQPMIYSSENFYPFYSTTKNIQQQQLTSRPSTSSFHKLSPAITLISEQQQQQQDGQDYMKIDSLVGKMPTKSIMSLSKLSSEQNTGYGVGSINGYNDGTSDRYSQNINDFYQQQQQQQQQDFIPQKYTTTNYQPLNSGQKSVEHYSNSRSNMEFLPSYDNNDNPYNQQTEQTYMNLNNYDAIKLKNLMQEYTIYIENQLQKHKNMEESKKQQDNHSALNYQNFGTIVQSNEQNKIIHTPNSASINTSQDIPSGSNLIDNQQQQQYDVAIPTKTIYYQPHEILLTSSPSPPSSASIPTDEIQYPKTNYYQPTEGIDHSYHNTGSLLQNYYSDKQKSIVPSGNQAAIAALSLQTGGAIPISKHVQVTKHIPIPIYKQIHVPIRHPVKINITHPVIMTVPKPYPIQIPITKPIVVPMVKEVKLSLEKIVPYPVEKRIPYTVEKHVPYTIEKYVRVPIVKPYPVKVPIVQTILHKSKVHKNYFSGWPF